MKNFNELFEEYYKEIESLVERTFTELDISFTKSFIKGVFKEGYKLCETQKDLEYLELQSKYAKLLLKSKTNKFSEEEMRDLIKRAETDGGVDWDYIDFYFENNK